MNDDIQSQRDHYGYRVSLPTCWMDNDVYGHVNNVTYYSYFDTAANDFLVRVGGLDMHNDDQVGFVVASGCQFKQPVAFPDQLDIGVRVNRLGKSSVEYGIAVFRENDSSAAAFGHFTHVFVSRQSQRPVTIPARMRKALETLVDYGA